MINKIINHFCIIFTVSMINFPIFSQSSNKILNDDSKLIKLFEEGFFLEGPAYADGNIYFSDLTFTSETNMQAGIIWKHNLQTGKTLVYRSPSGMANGISIDKKGNMIVCEGADFGERKITCTDLKSGKSKILTALFKNLPFNSPNDLTIDSKNRIYFTDPRYAGYEKIEQPCFGVYRIESGGEVQLIIDDIEMPNGIAISPNEDRLYVGCNFEGNIQKEKNPLNAIFVFDLDENGNASNKKIFIQYPEEFCPDGIKVDMFGNVYIALRDEKNPGIYIYNPNAKLIEKILVPEVPNNLTFGKGKFKNTLFITAGKSLYKIKVLTEGKN